MDNVFLEISECLFGHPGQWSPNSFDRVHTLKTEKYIFQNKKNPYSIFLIKLWIIILKNVIY